MNEHIIFDRSPRESVPERGVNRRDFLKIAGFSLSGAVVAGCSPGKVQQAIPFLIKPEEVTPGVATWYATTCGGCSAGCGVLAKNRDGRPIKLEGAPNHPVSKGGLCAVGQAHLLTLYDSHRLMHPVMLGAEASWEAVDRSVVQKLDNINARGGAIRLLTGTVSSPTVKSEIQKFLSRYPGAKHIQYDPLSCSAILSAHETTHGARVLPRYRFDLAKVVAGFDADFLGTWISPVEFTADYQAGRKLEGEGFSYHVQFESAVSLTGSNADRRIALSPPEVRSAIRRLAALIAGEAGESYAGPAVSARLETALAKLARNLWEAKGHCLVISGINDVESQVLVNYINHLLGNYGSTLDIIRPSFQRGGDDRQLREFLDELFAGKISAAIICGVNPAYSLPEGSEVAKALQTLELSVCITDRMDETAGAVQFVCPQPHPLESWNDAEPVAGTFSITQPVLSPFGNTRTFLESLSAWNGNPQPSYDRIRGEWEATIFKRQSREHEFQAFWDKAVYDGFTVVDTTTANRYSFHREAVQPVTHPDEADTPYQLVIYPKISMLDGSHAHNPWLQELPDPVSKIVWDNYVSLSPLSAGEIGVAEGDVVRVGSTATSMELPVHIQLGQHDGVAAVAMGYGRKGTDRFATIGPPWIEARPTVPEGELVGKNVAPFLVWENGALQYDAQAVRITKTGRRYTLAATQEHNSLNVPARLDPAHGEPRPIVLETTLASFARDAKSGGAEEHDLPTMWPDEHTYTGYRWGMAIDLTACTGCSACVVSCQAENNIPLVGKDEVFRNRELTWIRVDRYYEERKDGSLSVQHQPMMCQHCADAPCETVCPVLATVHSEEGLNQQVYNRCVGTRYCSNNCPYKVRRFNWFDYDHGDDRERLVLNPDVTTRERGVMEKCSMCIQRIQVGKIEAKKKGTTVKDGDILPACAQSCPANAIVFGDMNNPDSRLAHLMKNPRYYKVLEELGVRPSVGYMMLVRNREEEDSHV